MKNYIGTKVIAAKPMNRGDYNKYRGWTIPENENPEDEGFLVKYEDGYESWSPKEQFEEAYKAFDEGMTFGSAIELLKKNFKLSRKGWNGKGMHLFLVQGKVIKECMESEQECNDVICMKTAQNTVVFGWLASQTDMLSEDWIVVD